MKAIHGMTAETYDAMVEAQDSRCAGCSKSFRPSDLLVDHDGDTGQPRALICQGCSTVLAYACDDAERLMALAAYVLSYENVEAS